MNSNSSLGSSSTLFKSNNFTLTAIAPKASTMTPNSSPGSYSTSTSTSTLSPHTTSGDYISISRGGVVTPFPYKLHMMLNAMDVEAARGDTDGSNKSIVSWQPHGRAFKVHKPKEFVDRIMPHFFNQNKYASFQRQLNLYGFSRITNVGPDKGAVYHHCFVRNQRNLVKGMVRRKVKGTKFRRIVSPEDQPNFYAKCNEHPPCLAAAFKNNNNDKGTTCNNNNNDSRGYRHNHHTAIG